MLLRQFFIMIVTWLRIWFRLSSEERLVRIFKDVTFFLNFEIVPDISMSYHLQIFQQASSWNSCTFSWKKFLMTAGWRTPSLPQATRYCSTTVTQTTMWAGLNWLIILIKVFLLYHIIFHVSLARLLPHYELLFGSTHYNHDKFAWKMVGDVRCCDELWWIVWCIFLIRSKLI